MPALSPAQSSSSLDPEAEALLRNIQANGFKGWSALGLEAGRAAILEMAGTLGGQPEHVRDVQSISIPRADGSKLDVTLYRPEAAHPLPVLVYMHGGGWVLGDHRAAHSVVQTLANRSRCAILSVNYRLAPENKYPAALDDVMTALHWTADHAHDFGLNATRIAVGGDSSGANLAACAALLCKQQDSIRLGLQLLVYPLLDHNYQTSSYEREASGQNSALSREDVRWFHNLYVSRPEELDLPTVSPLQARDFANLPRTLVISADFDPLLDDSTTYVSRLRAAGVPVEHHIVKGVFHGFWRMPGVLTTARQCIEYAATYMHSAMYAGQLSPNVP